MGINFVLMFIGAHTSEEFSVVEVAALDEMILVVFSVQLKQLIMSIMEFNKV